MQITMDTAKGRSGSGVILAILLGIAVLVSGVAFSEGLVQLVDRWTKQEEYGHAFFIPLLSVWLLWMRRDAIVQSIGRPSWFGLVVVLASIGMLVIGNLSAIYILAQVGFVLSLAGILMTFGGLSLLRICLLPLFFLLFAIPLPFFVDAALSWRLQLISSELGVFFIRLLNIPVYLEGNVIDLGEYQLLVAEACSGLRYLYPLLSLGFLTAYFFNAPLWQRSLLFLSTIPITIFMNSARIGMIGVLVNYWGIGMAEGFLHYFQGWAIFAACGLVLAGEIYLLNKFTSGRSFFESLRFPEVKAVKASGSPIPAKKMSPLFSAVASLGIAFVLIFSISNRVESVPDRQRFVSFPKQIGEWKGRTSFLRPRIELFLGVDDYILANYNSPGQQSINLYIAYYKSQRNGVSPHSPQACIPGGGWFITDLNEKQYLQVSDGNGGPMPYNRVVIQRGDVKQIVYYWFDQRGRKIANEYWAKWYLLKDAILMNRTDGTLVRLVTPVSQTESEEAADKRLTEFMSKLMEKTKKYIPGANLGSEV